MPRTKLHIRALRSAPPKVPTSLARLPDHRLLHSTGSPTAALETAATRLRRCWPWVDAPVRRFRESLSCTPHSFYYLA